MGSNNKDTEEMKKRVQKLVSRGNNCQLEISRATFAIQLLFNRNFRLNLSACR